MKSQNQSKDGNRNEPEAVITAKAVEAAMSSLRAAREGMPFLSALTPKERKASQRVTPASLILMEEAVGATQLNPGLLPASIDIAHFAGEVAVCRGLHNLLKELQELCSDVQDTLAACGKEANGTTLQVRVMVNAIAKTKPTPGLKLLARRLNPRSARTVEKPDSGAAPAPVLAPSALPPTVAGPPVVAPAPAGTPPAEPKLA